MDDARRPAVVPPPLQRPKALVETIRRDRPNVPIPQVPAENRAEKLSSHQQAGLSVRFFAGANEKSTLAATSRENRSMCGNLRGSWKSRAAGVNRRDGADRLKARAAEEAGFDVQVATLKAVIANRLGAEDAIREIVHIGCHVWPPVVLRSPIGGARRASAAETRRPRPSGAARTNR